MKKLLIPFIIILSILLSSCQYNDICTDNDPTTPRLVIKFYDAQKPGKLKPVEGFNAKEKNADKFYFKEAITDTIVKLPLQTGVNSVEYELVIFQNQDIDSIPAEQSGFIKFTYTPEDVYISRPCGFRNIFKDFDAQRIASASTWIEKIEIPHENQIDNEKITHLYIYH